MKIKHNLVYIDCGDGGYVISKPFLRVMKKELRKLKIKFKVKNL